MNILIKMMGLFAYVHKIFWGGKSKGLDTVLVIAPLT